MRIVVALLIALSLAGCSDREDGGPIVLAAASLQGPLNRIADEWARAGHPRPVISYAGSQVHARQVQAGAPADLVFLADREWMDALAAGGHLDEAGRRDVVSNAMVVVRSAGGAATASTPAAALASGRIAMGEPETVPAGRYGRAALVTLGLWGSVAPRVIPAENVRAALVLTERGEVDAAIVYASDAAASREVRVAAYLPESAHPQIRYPAARLRTSHHREAASFLEHLVSPEAGAIFARHGFRPLRRGE